MFIRRIARQLKNGKLATTYQAIESYRLDGKAKQHIVSLGSNPIPKEALEEELRFLKNAERCYNFPLSEWSETRFSPGGNPYKAKLSEKQARRRKEFWRKIYEGHLKKMGKLESIVSKYPAIKYAENTTSLQKIDRKREADVNQREIEEIIGS